MRIDCANTKYSFQANINSPKLRFKQADFFVKIRGYGKNKNWVRQIKTTTDTAVLLMRKNSAIENIVKLISCKVRNANRCCRDSKKAGHSGILRTQRQGWLSGSDWDGFTIYTNYSEIPRYRVYKQKLDNIIKNPLTNPYDDIGLTIPVIDEDGHFMQHADAIFVNNALKHIFDIYNSFSKKFNSKDINETQMEDVNNHIAEIRWIMAHATPWERGSDAISNILVRAMYKSIGIKSHPLKKGISLDLEAYCTELSDYKKQFPEYFEKPPEIIE